MGRTRGARGADAIFGVETTGRQAFLMRPVAQVLHEDSMLVRELVARWVSG